jgi:2-polyprenyl-6-methoxyphenol hydroxylase-like FAD-dependent oxidoreductase
VDWQFDKTKTRPGTEEVHGGAMSAYDYDLAIVGGGLGGAALAKAMAESGRRVLVLEKEPAFQDRVRGENLISWGGAEAERLGCFDLLRDRCGFQKRRLLAGGTERDLIATTPQQLPSLIFYHPTMQECMLEAAATAGAEIQRGNRVTSIAGGAPTNVQFEYGSQSCKVTARLAVGADGRSSMVRSWGNFKVERDQERLILAGVLLENVGQVPDDAFHFVINSDLAECAVIAGQDAGRARGYVGYRADSGLRLQGRESLPRFIEESVKCGIPADVYAKATIAGPLASFNGADNWVKHPYANGIALIGDAAAASDPNWGQGVALTLRDVRALRDALLADDDWDRAAHAYAAEHDRYYHRIHEYEDLLTEFFYGTSGEARARRAKAMPLISEDPSRVPDHVISGPELPLDASVRARLFGEA